MFPLCICNHYLLLPGVLFLSWTLTIHNNPSRHSSNIHTKGYKDAYYSQHCQSLLDNPASPFSLKHMNPWGISPSTSTGPGQICSKGKSWPSKMAYLRGKNILMNPINILGIYTMSCPGDTYEERKWTLRKEDELPVANGLLCYTVYLISFCEGLESITPVFTESWSGQFTKPFSWPWPLQLLHVPWSPSAWFPIYYFV